jgi:hypothetical protein
MLVFILLFMLEDRLVLKMIFTGQERELAQGAIERHELPHREIEPRVWLIAVEEGTPDEWARRLTAALPRDAGRFEGRAASPGEVEKVRRGEITLQK